MKLFFVSIAIILSLATKAQVTGVSLKASGLTCSMCSNAINKALYTLDFIDNVNADISNYTFEISFKAGSAVDFDKIKKKVEGAGFSVSGFTATIAFHNAEINNNTPLGIAGMSLRFLNASPQRLNGTRQVKLLNKGFVSSKEYKQSQIRDAVHTPGVYYVTL